MSNQARSSPRLGQLEASVMDCMWETDAALSVRDVLDLLRRDRQIAYTTVMTVMENLHRKGILQRERHGRAYHYRSVHSREEHTAHVIGQVLASSQDRTATLLHFVDQMDPSEVARLREALLGSGEEAVTGRALPAPSQPHHR